MLFLTHHCLVSRIHCGVAENMVSLVWRTRRYATTRYNDLNELLCDAECRPTFLSFKFGTSSIMTSLKISTSTIGEAVDL